MAPSFDITDWQLFVYILFSLLIIFSAWQGWLHGLGRSALMLGGVPIGYFVGKALGFIILDLYRNFIPYPEPILKELTNLIFGCLVYFLFVAGAIFLFKSTRKQETLRKKLVSGIGGVFFGICNGLVIAVVLTISIRLLGIANISIPPQPGSLEYRQKQEVYLPEHSAKSDKIIVNIYRAIMKPPIEKWIKLGDPINESFYTLLLNLKIFTQREDLLQNFIASEKIQQLLQSPEIASLLENSTVPALMEAGKFHDILRNPDFHEIYSKPSSAALIGAIDWSALTSEIIAQSDLANHPDL